MLELRIVDGAQYRGVRHAGLLQRGANRIDTLAAQGRIERIHGAVDAKLERRVTGEVRSDDGGRVPVRSPNVRRTAVEREITVFGPVSDCTNRALGAHRPGRPRHALCTGESGTADATFSPGGA